MRALLKIGTGLLVLAFVLIGVTYSMLKAYGSTSPTSMAGRSLGGAVSVVFAGIHAWLIWKLCTPPIRAQFEPSSLR